MRLTDTDSGSDVALLWPVHVWNRVIFSTKSKFVRASLKSQVHEGKFKLSHKSIDKTVIQ